MALNIIQQHNPYEQIITGCEKREKTHVVGKSDTKDSSPAHQEGAYRILGMGMFFASGATVAGGLAAIVFDGWPVALAAILGGVLGIFYAALCQVSS